MTSAEKLYQRMRRTKAGWKPSDLDRLYRGFGFEVREGAKHTLYIHPEFPNLRATVTRSRSLAVGYIEHALELIEALKQERGGIRDG
jgi:hypothetical protein